MPTNQPSNAPDQLPKDAANPEAPGAVLSDEQLDDAPGGGGLGGQAAADAAAGAGVVGAAAPNAPITPSAGTGDNPAALPEAVEDPEGSGRAQKEAQVRATVTNSAPEPHPRSM